MWDAVGLQVIYKVELQQILPVLHSGLCRLGEISQISCRQTGMQQRAQQEHAAYAGVSLYWRCLPAGSLAETIMLLYDSHSDIAHSLSCRILSRCFPTILVAMCCLATKSDTCKYRSMDSVGWHIKMKHAEKCQKFLQVLEDWEPSEYDRHIDLMEAATVKAAQDSCSEVRVVARSMFAAYSALQPTRAHALLKRQIPSLQGMLNQGMLQYVPRECACSEILHAEADANAAGWITAACSD